MSEVAQVRAEIAETKTAIAKTKAKIKDADNAGDFARRDRLEALQISLVERLRGLEEDLRDLRRKEISAGSATESPTIKRVERELHEVRKRQEEIEHEVRKWQEQVAQSRSSFASCAESRAERVSRLRSEGELCHSGELDDELQGFQVSWWPVGGRKNFPAGNKNDNAFCQCFVSAMLSLCASGTVKIVDRSEKKTVVVRSVPYPEAYKRRMFHNRGPDCLFFEGEERSGVTGVTMEGEVERSGRDKFADDELGQVVDGLIRFMNVQTERMDMLGFVTDGNRIQFIRIHRQGDDYQFVISRLFWGAQGWQILFGLMVADPHQVGYRRISIPGFHVGEFLGAGAYCVVYKGQPVETSSEDSSKLSSGEDSSEEKYCDSPVLPRGFTQRVVLGDGNCFFHAIADQLRHLNIPDEKGEPYTAELLRGLVVSRVAHDSRLRALISDDEHADLSRLNGWVDHGAIAALAAVLDVNVVVHVVGGFLPTVTFNPESGLGEATPGLPTLRIIFNVNHYNSVVPRPTPTSTAAAAAASAAGAAARASLGKRKIYKTYSLRARKKHAQQRRVVKSDSLPVAIKIFKKNDKINRNKRDHEHKILERLKVLDNVPRVVVSANAPRKPALVVSPAGYPVLPEKRGVFTNSTDYVLLVGVLRFAHSLGICHRDVKPQNIFKDDNGRVILSDWGSAAYVGEEVPWEGTRYFYDRPSGYLGYHTPHPQDDLVALVRTVYMLHTRDDPRRISRFPWEGTITSRMEGSSRFRRALQAAKELDYDELMKIFGIL